MSSKTTANDFLLCVACRRLLTEPVTLSCGHTFCRQCVASPTQTQQQDTQDNPAGTITVSCPICQTKTEVPSADESAKDWRTRRQKNSFVQNLVDPDINKQSGSRSCTVCKEEGKRKDPAIWCSFCECHLCAECQKVHGRLNSSHSVTDIVSHKHHQLPKTVKCDKHEDAVPNLLCDDCDEVVCQQCCILDHRSCKRVVPLHEAKKQIDSALHTWSKDLEKQLPELRQNVSFFASYGSKFDRMISDTQRSIDAVSDDLVAEIRFQQKQLKSKLTSMNKEINEKLKEDTKVSEMRLAEARQRLGFSEEALMSPSLLDHFEVYQMFANIRKAESKKGAARDLKSNPLYKKEITFSSNRDTLVRGLQKKWIGYLCGGSEEAEPKDKPIIDIGVPNLHDMAMFKIDSKVIVLVTSPDLKVLQWFCKSEPSDNGVVRLDSPAFAIDRLEATKAVTTLPRKKQIFVLKVYKDKVEKDFSVKTQLRYVGLTALSSTILAATGEDSGFVDILDLTGARLRSFGADLLDKPMFIAGTAEGNVLVTDCERRQVVCFTDEGEVLFQYEPQDIHILEYPCGVAEAANGDIFVVDRQQHKILQLSETGNFIGDAYDFLDGVSEPCAVLIDERNDIYFSVENRYIRSIHIDI